jgi:hypothetical protein
VVIGNHVADVYAEVNEQLGGVTASQEEQPSGSLLDRFIDLISGIFQPVLGVMAAVGMVKGFNVLFETLGLYPKESGTYIILNGIGDAFFTFLPIFLGFTAAQKFKVRPMVGVACGAVLCYPALQLSALSGEDAKALYTLFEGTNFASDVYMTFLGIPVISMDYMSTVIPIIFVVYFASKLEPIFNRIVPEVVKFFFVPLLTILISSVVGLLLIGPVAVFGSTPISQLVLEIRDFSPLIAGIIVGGTWQILMIFGLHWGFIPVYINNIVTMGFDNVMMPFYCASFATTGAVAAAYFRTKDEQKKLSIPAFISAFFGVTEPAVYGLLLPLRRPFIVSCIVSAAVGGYYGAMNLRKFMGGGMGPLELPAMIDESGDLGNVTVAITGIVVALILGFAGTFLFYKEPKEEEKQIEDTTTTTATISSPLAGEIRPLAECSDKAFASGALGTGVVIIPSEGVVKAPFSGRVTALFPTLHAIGLTADSGQELPIHVGIDTVQLKGNGFESLVKQKEQVTEGQELLKFDTELIQSEGYSIETPVLLTNASDEQEVIITDAGVVKHGEPLITVAHKSAAMEGDVHVTA